MKPLNELSREQSRALLNATKRAKLESDLENMGVIDDIRRAGERSEKQGGISCKKDAHKRKETPADGAASLFKFTLVAHGLPHATPEHRFAPPRRWRFDYAWPHARLALEVQGGTFIAGRHSRGAALLKEWEKLNTAAAMGWRILYCQPKDLCSPDTIRCIAAALKPTA